MKKKIVDIKAEAFDYHHIEALNVVIEAAREQPATEWIANHLEETKDAIVELTKDDDGMNHLRVLSEAMNRVALSNQ